MDNKELVSTVITAVFVNRDVSALDKYFDIDYIQHNPQIPNGIEALRQLIKGLKTDFRYVPGIITEAGEFVMIHGHYTGWAEKPMIAVDIFRIRNGKLAEHWDVMQEEITSDESINGNKMFPIN